MALPARGDLPAKVLGLIIRPGEHSGLKADGLHGSLDDKGKGKGYEWKMDNPTFQKAHKIRVWI
jgi:hypothetical protein